jgi:hypothetical protein
MNDVKQSSGLWLDDPSAVDLLSFDAVAQTVADLMLDEALDPARQTRGAAQAGPMSTYTTRASGAARCATS